MLIHQWGALEEEGRAGVETSFLRSGVPHAVAQHMSHAPAFSNPADCSGRIETRRAQQAPAARPTTSHCRRRRSGQTARPFPPCTLPALMENAYRCAWRLSHNEGGLGGSGNAAEGPAPRQNTEGAQATGTRRRRRRKRRHCSGENRAGEQQNGSYGESAQLGKSKMEKSAGRRHSSVGAALAAGPPDSVSREPAHRAAASHSYGEAGCSCALET